MALHRGLLKVAGALVAGAVACVALGFQMSDIGHFVGFICAAAVFVVGALYVLSQARV